MAGGPLDKVFNVVDRKRASYINLLRDAVAIRSARGDESESNKAVTWVETKLKELGASTTLVDVGKIEYGGKTIKLPPALIANLKSKSSKVTLLVYGHLDVIPGKLSDYNLSEENDILFGKGVTDSKGPLLCWINAIQAYKELDIDLPVNIRFLIESMKESGSIGLMEYLQNNRGSLFNNVNYICISDSSCQYTSKPVITYGLRGLCKFEVTVEGGNTVLHSGVHGGMVAEPMNDMVHLLSNLTDNRGEILIPNFRDNVDDVTPEEERAYHALTFDVAAFKKSIGVDKLLHKDDKKRLLMHRSRFPSLSILGTFTGNDLNEDIVPCKVTATFDIRIVPNQTPQEIFHKVQLYLMYLFNKTHSSNRLSIDMLVAIPPWLAKPDDENYKSAINAITKVYKVEPDLIREGSSIPIVRELQDLSGKSVLLLPVGNASHNITKNRDRIDVKTFMDGTKVVASYIYELSIQTTKLNKKRQSNK